LYEASGSQAPRVELAERVTPLPAGGDDHGHDDDHAHDDGLAHACKHFGDDPVAVTAAATSTEATAVMPDDHTRYDLTLSNGEGFVAFEQDRDGDVLFFLGSETPLTLFAGDTPVVPESVEPISEGCDAVAVLYTFDLEPGSYVVQFGPQAETLLTLVWERGEGHSHSEEEHHDDDHGHSHGEYDPHIWQDPNNAMLMVEVIRDALSEADPANADTYQLNTERYLAELTTLDAFVQAEVSRLPVEARKLVTTHDTFAYFADRYEFTVVGTALGTTTENADPSAGDLAALVNEIRAVGVPAIFADNVSNPTLMETIAREAGVTLVTDLHTDALSQPEGSAGTYVAMIQHNV
ncbi:MAG: zinc ABC transporter substrate-binding protein, partial [Chloroflexia bacterium]|nr:zinc ABC transporter substrate-binding protein [Chloroflexia bacterium]